MSSFEVTWNGGPLLPPRPERTAPCYAPGEPTDAVRTGRYCACGCGQEMIYKAKTAKNNALFKPGHSKRAVSYQARKCQWCLTGFTPVVGAKVTKFCNPRCAGKFYRKRRKGRTT
jgi:hypothetical protein